MFFDCFFMMPEMFYSASTGKGVCKKVIAFSDDLRMLLRILDFELIAWY